MAGFWIRRLALLLMVAGAVGACASHAGQPGYYGPQQAGYHGPSGGSRSGSNLPSAQAGEAGRVTSIHQVGGGGSGSGPMMGGFVGGLAGSMIGTGISHTVGGGLIGLAIGAIAGAIAGQIVDPARRSGIEVTVEKQDGQRVVVVQADDGDVQLGDLVRIVPDGRGAARAVRDTSAPPE